MIILYTHFSFCYCSISHSALYQNAKKSKKFPQWLTPQTRPSKSRSSTSSANDSTRPRTSLRSYSRVSLSLFLFIFLSYICFYANYIYIKLPKKLYLYYFYFFVLQNVKDYEGIIEAAKTSLKAKQLAAQLIPRFFKFFPDLSSRAVDAHLDLIEEEELGVSIYFLNL